MRVRSSIVAVVVLMSLSLTRADPPGKDWGANPNSPTTAPSGKRVTLDKLYADQLADPDPVKQQACLDAINKRLAEPRSFVVSETWIRSLRRVHRYDDAQSLALAGILKRPGDVKNVAALQKGRVQCLLDQQKYDLAVSAAKSYYNVCRMGDSAAAIELLSVCLANAHPDDKDIAARFKAQQVASATTQPAAQPQTAPENILSTIVIDPKPYEQALKDNTFKDISHLLGKGNLLLLSDRPKDARECFEAARSLARGEDQFATVTEGIARAIRAETDGIGPANAYILAQQQK